MAVFVDNLHPRLRVHKRALAGHVRAMLRQLGRPGADVDVRLTDDGEMRQLNRQYRGVDSITDVLSFAIEDDPGEPGMIDHLGDVVVSLDTALRQARMLRQQQPESGYRLRDETFFLVTHGVLHLLGYDHQRSADADQMEALERRLLGGLIKAELHNLDRAGHGNQ